MKKRKDASSEYKNKEEPNMNKKDLPDNKDSLNKDPNKKGNKSFKIDKSFLKND